jgi:hypothetical protein
LRGVEGAVDGPPKVEVVESDRCKNVVMWLNSRTNRNKLNYNEKYKK